MEDSSQWEKQTLEKLLLEGIHEKRRARRWGIFFKLLFIFYIVFITYAMGIGSRERWKGATEPHVALIDIRGMIAAGAEASADNIIAALQSASDNAHVRAVILRVNSPGGSPVQARQVYDEIHQFKKSHPNVPVVAAIEDIGTSGAYLIACGADDIYADETSLVGSIGVLMDGFGFVEGMNKLGVERRLYTAGTHKGMLDPFSPRNAEDEKMLQEQLRQIHNAFIENVRNGRGDRLVQNPDLFSGRFWTGAEAKTLGLIDGFKSAGRVASEVFQLPMQDYTEEPDMFDRLAKSVGARSSASFKRMQGMDALRWIPWAWGTQWGSQEMF